MNDLATSRKLALCALAGPVIFTVAWVVLGFVSSGFTIFGTRVEPYSPISHPISGLGLGETAPYMNTAFVVMGVLIVLGVLGSLRAIPELGAAGRWTSIVLLGLTGVGAAMCGIFDLEAQLPHFIGFGVACGLPVVSFVVAGFVLRRVPRWRTFGNGLMTAGPVTLGLFALSQLTFDEHAAAVGAGIAGLAQRLLVVEVLAWFVALGWLASRRPPRTA